MRPLLLGLLFLSACPGSQPGWKELAKQCADDYENSQRTIAEHLRKIRVAHESCLDQLETCAEVNRRCVATCGPP